jgi:nucleotide-binding universal stress UspA family protein
MQRIVVGVDGSDHARKALQWAVDEARLRHAQLVAVHAWHYPYLSSGPLAPAPEVPLNGIEDEARGVLDHALERIDTDGLEQPIERLSVCDGSAHALLDAAKDADLLVVGSRGRGGFAGLLLGSVSQEVAHHAPCPIVIVRHDRA